MIKFNQEKRSIMNTYTELKNKEKEIIETIRNLRVEKIKLIEELEENSKKYPNQFKALPEIEEIDLCDMNRRFDVIEESIRISKLEEETKNSILELLKSIKERFSQNQEKAKYYDNEKSINNLKLEEREKYLEEKLSKIEENIKLIKRKDKTIIFHKQLLANEEIDNSVKEEAQKVISRLQAEKESLIEENEGILKEPNLKEDLKLLLDSILPDKVFYGTNVYDNEDNASIFAITDAVFCNLSRLAAAQAAVRR